MELIETALSETSVRMRFSDQEDISKAKHWLDFQVPLEKLSLLLERPLGDPEAHFLAEIRQEALRYVRDVVSAETQRIANLAGRMR
jgi:hypothetical protein